MCQILILITTLFFCNLLKKRITKCSIHKLQFIASLSNRDIEVKRKFQVVFSKFDFIFVMHGNYHSISRLTRNF